MITFDADVYQRSPLEDSRDRADRALLALTDATRRRPPRILVLERESFVAGRLERLLSRAGCEIARTREEGDVRRLLQAGGGDVDLVVLDLSDESGTGGGTVEEALEAGVGVPILLLYDPGQGTDGASGHPFLRKPFGPTELLEKVALVLSGPRRPRVANGRS